MLWKMVNKRVVSGIRFRIFAVLSQFCSHPEVGIASCDRVWKLMDQGLPTFDGISGGVGSLGLLGFDRLKPEIDAPSEENEDQHECADDDLLFVKRPKYLGNEIRKRLGRLRRG